MKMRSRADQSRARETLGRNRLAGESACPTKMPALAHQSGTDAFVCQPGALNDLSLLLTVALALRRHFFRKAATSAPFLNGP